MLLNISTHNRFFSEPPHVNTRPERTSFCPGKAPSYRLVDIDSTGRDSTFKRRRRIASIRSDDVDLHKPTKRGKKNMKTRRYCTFDVIVCKSAMLSPQPNCHRASDGHRSMQIFRWVGQHRLDPPLPAGIRLPNAAVTSSSTRCLLLSTGKSVFRNRYSISCQFFFKGWL